MKRKAIFISIIILILLSIIVFQEKIQKQFQKAELIQTSTPYTVTGTPSPTITATAIVQPELVLLAEMGNGTIPDFFRSPDGSKIFISDGYDAKVYDGVDHFGITTIPLSDDGYGIVDSTNQDGTLVVTSNFGSMGFKVMDLFSGDIIASGYGSNGSTSGETFTNDEKYIIYSSNGRTTGGPYHIICREKLIGEHTEEDNNFLNKCYLTGYDDYRYTVTSNPAISPDGKLVAAGYRDSTRNVLFIWDLESREIIHKLDHQPDMIDSVTFTPDGSMLVSAGDDGIVRFWNTYTGKQVRTINTFTNDISKISFQENPNELIVRAYNQDSMIYDLSTGKTSPKPATPLDPYIQEMIDAGYMLSGGTSFNIYSGRKSFVLFSPDGNKIAIGDGNIQIWNIASQSLKTSLYAKYSLDLVSMVYSNDGKMIAAAVRDGNVYVWNIETSELVFSTQVASMSDPQVYFAAGYNGIGPAIGSDVYGEYGITFSSDDQQIIIPNGLHIDFWELSSSTITKTIHITDPSQIPFRITTHQNGNEIYTLMNRNRNVLSWDVYTGEQTGDLNLPDVDASAFTATALEGKWLARNNADSEPERYWIELINLETGEITKLNTYERDVAPLRFSKNGKYLAALLDNRRLSLWETDTGNLVFISEPNFTELNDFAVDDHTNTLATVNAGQIKLWDLSPFVELSSISETKTAINTPTITPTYEYSSDLSTSTPEPTLIVETQAVPETSKNAITRNNSKDVKLIKTIGKGAITDIYWGQIPGTLFVISPIGIYEMDSNTRQIVNEFQRDGFWISHHQQLSDETQLITGYNTDLITQVWKDNNPDSLFEFENASEPAISPDGKWLVFANQNDGLTTWNLENNQQGPDLLSNSGYYSQIRFSPDGKFVAAICSYRTARIWELDTGIVYNTVGGSEDGIVDIQFSADSKYLVGAAGGDAWVWGVDPDILPRRIQLFEPKYKGNLSIYLDFVSAVAINPTNTSFAVGTNEREIIFYNPANGLEQNTIRGLPSKPVKMIFSSDGKALVVADENGQISFVNLIQGDVSTSGLEFSGQFKNILSRQDGDLATWISNIYYIIDQDDLFIKSATIVDTDQILAGDPSGKIILGYEPYQVSMFNEQDGTLIKTLPEEAEDVFVEYQFEGSVLQQFYDAMFTPNGDHFITSGTGGVWYYDSNNGNLLSHIEGQSTKRAAFSSDGQWVIASRSSYAQVPYIYDISAGLDAANYRLFSNRSSSVYENRIYQYLFHPDTSQIAMIYYDYDGINWVKIVDTSTHEGVAEFSLEDTRLVCEAYSPDGKILAVGTMDGQIYLFDSTTLEIYANWQAHIGQVTALAFVMDGSQLFSTSNEGTIKVWGIR
ncbi:MAG: PD40 domain-containing protein [Anaerolineaceae bacterium]|nr:PD40 domain-containing protein [Anaerolineaceae bacterium]